MNHPDTQVEIDPKAFRTWIAEYPKGQLDHELSEALAVALGGHVMLDTPAVP